MWPPELTGKEGASTVLDCLAPCWVQLHWCALLAGAGALAAQNSKRRKLVYETIGLHFILIRFPCLPSVHELTHIPETRSQGKQTIWSLFSSGPFVMPQATFFLISQEGMWWIIIMVLLQRLTIIRNWESMWGEKWGGVDEIEIYTIQVVLKLRGFRLQMFCMYSGRMHPTSFLLHPPPRHPTPRIHHPWRRWPEPRS